MSEIEIKAPYREKLVWADGEIGRLRTRLQRAEELLRECCDRPGYYERYGLKERINAFLGERND